MKHRIISDSQIKSVLSCQVKYDLGYVGQLVGGRPLKKRTPYFRLSAGRAWGAAIQMWHLCGNKQAALAAAGEEFARDEDEIVERGGVIDDVERADTWATIEDVLNWYVVNHPEPLNLTSTEVPLFVTLTRGYRLEGYVDGEFRDADGRLWLYEAKYRSKLTSYDQIMRDRQVWLYAWAWEKQYGEAPVGAIKEEVLAEAPKPVRFNQDGTPSATQSCTLNDYLAACRCTATEPRESTVEALNAKKRMQRVEILFTKRGVELAGKQAQSAARLIGMFDRGDLAPIHNPSQMSCSTCAFKDVCVDPTDEGVIDALFERVDPARYRQEARHG